MQYLRSFVFTAYMMLSAVVYGAFMSLLFWMPYRWHFAIARSWARMIFALLERICGLRYHVTGRENIPAGTHIVMSNHTSAWETIAQFLLFPPQVWVLKRELLWIPFIGWGLKLLHPIAINRSAGHRAVNQVIEQGKARLAAGLWVIIFPEGTRVIAGQAKKYGLSGALLATTSGKMVVPLSHNAGDFWARRGLLKKPGVIQVVIGAPIESAGKDARTLNEEIRAAIEGGLAAIRDRSSL